MATVTRSRCLTYISVPHLGLGFVQTCVSILENFPSEVLSAAIVLPRAFQPILPCVDVREAVPYPIPFRYASPIVHRALHYRFRRAIAASDPRDTILYFWPNPPLSLIRHARKRGFLTVREMINTCASSVRAILEDAYARLGLPFEHESGRNITNQIVQSELEELTLHDYIISPNPNVEKSLIETGVNPAKILRSTYGWSPTRFASKTPTQKTHGFRALFVGRVGVRKGVPQLLAAWKKSGVVGELLLAGQVEDALKPLLAPLLDSHGVRLAGFVSDVECLYKSADLFIFPTLEEGDPQVTYEAAGCGLPIITTPMGTANLIVDGINGLVVPPFDVDRLAQAISHMANSPELRIGLARRAAIDAQNFTYDKVGRERAVTLNGLLKALR